LNPETVLDLLSQAVRQRRVKISLHAVEMAMKERISRREIEEALLFTRMLEDYPELGPGPYCPVYGRTKSGRHLHAVVYYESLPVTVIGVYEPHPPEWVTPTVRAE
jgi:hypothetical protein